MWEIDIALQFYYCLLSAVLGGIYCIFYDFFRAIRLSIKFSDLAVFLQDIIYFFVISFATFSFLLATTNGQVRGYVLFGLVIGFMIVRYTVSFILMKIYSFVLKMIFSVIKRLLVVKNMIFSYFERIFSSFLKNSRNFFKKAANSLKKLLKKQSGSLYTNTIKD